MKPARHVAAVDLGAESGRVMICRWDGERGELREVHRFPNCCCSQDGHLIWDLEGLWENVLMGLKKAARAAGGLLDSIGIDGWAVDYVLIDAAGDRIGAAHSYRDSRCPPAMTRALEIVSRERLYELTGIQFLPFNTLYQLLAHRQEHPREWARARLWLNLPEYFSFRLTGNAAAEYTNATHTQMVDIRERTWSGEVQGCFGLEPDKFPPILPPGTELGKLRPRWQQELGLSQTQVILPACHDTGSAVAGIPWPPDRLAFISSGTWSLVGTVLDAPRVTPEAREHNYTNEGGVCGSIRFLKNVIGLWLLQQAVQEWNRRGLALQLSELAASLGHVPAEGSWFEADSEPFLTPGDMIGRMRRAAEAQGYGVSEDPKELTATILRSLARRYAEVLAGTASISGKRLERVAIVGGGVRNEVLNSLTESLSGLELLRGPAEATAIGNAALQIHTLERAGVPIWEVSSRIQTADSP